MLTGTRQQEIIGQYMKIGPFPPRDIESISKVLKELNVHFSVAPDADLLDRLINKKGSIPAAYVRLSVGNFDPSFVFFEINEKDVHLVGGALENYGVVFQPFQPEMDGVDYICPKCRYSAFAPGSCPHDGGNLVDYDLYRKNLQDESRKRMTSPVAKVVVIIVILILLGFFVTTPMLRH